MAYKTSNSKRNCSNSLSLNRTSYNSNNSCRKRTNTFEEFRRLKIKCRKWICNWAIICLKEIVNQESVWRQDRIIRQISRSYYTSKIIGEIVCRTIRIMRRAAVQGKSSCWMIWMCIRSIINKQIILEDTTCPVDTKQHRRKSKLVPNIMKLSKRNHQLKCQGLHWLHKCKRIIFFRLKSKIHCTSIHPFDYRASNI